MQAQFEGFRSRPGGNSVSVWPTKRVAAYPAADHAFSDSEARSTLRSVLRYRAQWRARGHAPWWITLGSRARGRAGGLSGGVARRAAVRERDLRIVVLREAGLSQREVAAVVGVKRDVVRGAADRLARGGG